MLQFVNIFFVPAISVYIIEREKENGFKLLPKLFMLYASMVVVIIALSHIIMVVLYCLFELVIADTTPKYTLLALVVAYAVPYLYKIVKFRVELLVERK